MVVAGGGCGWWWWVVVVGSGWWWWWRVVVSFFVVVVALMLYQLKFSLAEVVTIEMPSADAIVVIPPLSSGQRRLSKAWPKVRF